MNNDPALSDDPALGAGAPPGSRPLVPAEISQPGGFEEEFVSLAGQADEDRLDG